MSIFATTPAWIAVEDALPEVGQSVWYFFEVTGVTDGHYHGLEDGLHTFGGKRGFLGGDVTHWMPKEASVEPPAPPAGYSRAERWLFHGAQMPFDCPETGRLGTHVAPATPAKDWAHAAARGVFERLYDDHEFRATLRATPDETRVKLVKQVSDIIREAARLERRAD
jgi:hypothetical protein